jgi:hypothetical protein
MIRIIAMVYNIKFLPAGFVGWHAIAPAGNPLAA